MAFQILINTIIAVIWMFFQNSYTLANFIFGFVIGIIIIFLLRRFLVFDFYLNRVWALVKLTVLFISELIKANIDVAKIVLKPNLANQPGICAVRTKLESPFEITLLAALISLTPGTVSMEFSKDNKTIYIHALHVPDKDELVDSIRNSFERAIMEVTR